MEVKLGLTLRRLKGLSAGFQRRYPQYFCWLDLLQELPVPVKHKEVKRGDHIGRTNLGQYGCRIQFCFQL